MLKTAKMDPPRVGQLAPGAGEKLVPKLIQKWIRKMDAKMKEFKLKIGPKGGARNDKNQQKVGCAARLVGS